MKVFLGVVLAAAVPVLAQQGPVPDEATPFVTSVVIPVVDGKPVLGQFQSVMLAEFDGPRQRAIHVQVLGE